VPPASTRSLPWAVLQGARLHHAGTFISFTHCHGNNLSDVWWLALPQEAPRLKKPRNSLTLRSWLRSGGMPLRRRAPLRRRSPRKKRLAHDPAAFQDTPCFGGRLPTESPRMRAAPCFGGGILTTWSPQESNLSDAEGAGIRRPARYNRRKRYQVRRGAGEKEATQCPYRR